MASYHSAVGLHCRIAYTNMVTTRDNNSSSGGGGGGERGDKATVIYAVACESR